MIKCLMFHALIAVVFVHCSNEYKESPKVNNQLCDTIFYSLKENVETEKIIDSILGKLSVANCNLKFSNLFDTLFLSFSIVDSGSLLNNEIPSNRFLLLNQKRIKVLSGEDYFIPLKERHTSITLDPSQVVFTLGVPGLEILSVSKYPFLF